MAEPMETQSGRYLELSDDALIKQCDVGCYRARGPGGQKRNKTSSAVRVRHQPTGLQASAVGSRSQHVNKRHAVRRLRRVIALQLRSPVDLASYCPSPLLSEYLTKEGRLSVNLRNRAYYPADEWRKLETKINDLPAYDQVAQKFRRTVYASAQECPLDRSGRVLVPPNLRTHAGLGRDVVLAGMGKKFEIWDKERYDSMIGEVMENPAAFAAAMGELGL